MEGRILVIDDDELLNQVLVKGLHPRGFEVLSATNGRKGIRMAYETQPDLVILDIMMPEMDGWQTCERLREMSDVPIIMLTAKSEGRDVVRGFELGVDDYITKPFHLKELELRIRAVLKRAKTRGWGLPRLYDDGVLKIDLEQRRVSREGVEIHLTPTEFRLLSCLLRHKGRVVPRGQLLTEVWGPAYEDAAASLAIYIRYLRKKLEEDPGEPEYIRTEWGIGYWFAPTEPPPAEEDADPR